MARLPRPSRRRKKEFRLSLLHDPEQGRVQAHPAEVPVGSGGVPVRGRARKVRDAEDAGRCGQQALQRCVERGKVGEIGDSVEEGGIKM